MTGRHRKLSEVMKEMAETLFRNSRTLPSSEAAHVALLFAHIAWNESVGLNYARDDYRKVWETIEADNPELWKEFKSTDRDAMIDELVEYKKTHFPDDRQRILTCGIPEGNVRVEWLAAAAPGVDSKWEMHLYGLVRTGDCDKAIRFLQATRNWSRTAAADRVAAITAELRMD